MKYIFAVALLLTFNTTSTMHQKKLTPQQISQKRMLACSALKIFTPMLVPLMSVCFVTAHNAHLTDIFSNTESSLFSGALAGLTVSFVAANFTTDLLTGEIGSL